MRTIHRQAVLVQRMVEGTAIARRRNTETGTLEYLLRWTGTAGEVHEVWYPERLIKLED